MENEFEEDQVEGLGERLLRPSAPPLEWKNDYEQPIYPATYNIAS